MALPMLLAGGMAARGVAGRLLGGRIGAAATGASLGIGLPSFGGGGPRRRRRRRRLTQSEIQQLAMIKEILGKTAAANALPFYLGR